MIAYQKDLRTGLPVWSAYKTPRIKTSRLEKDSSADIVIIGAGISGAMMAEAIACQNINVMVIDRCKPLSGSTAASTSLIQYEIDMPLTHMIDRIGKDKAILAWRKSRLAVESLAAKIRDLDIDCGFERRDSLYLSGNILNEKELEKERDARVAIGLQGNIISRRQIWDDYNIKAGPALLSRDNLLCNPLQLAAGFFKAAIQKGAVIYSPVNVTGIERHKGHIIINTEDGPKIKAHKIIFATGYEIPRIVHTTKHKIFSTWAIATKPVKGLMAEIPMIWEASDPYIYARPTPDGRMLFGGEDEEFSDSKKRDALIAMKMRILEKRMRKIFPGYDFSTEFAWAGSFGSSKTGLPSIGEIPGNKNCYAVMAYGGNGITFSRMAAEIIAGGISGMPDPDVDLFTFK